MCNLIMDLLTGVASGLKSFRTLFRPRWCATASAKPGAGKVKILQTTEPPMTGITALVGEVHQDGTMQMGQPVSISGG